MSEKITHRVVMEQMVREQVVKVARQVQDPGMDSGQA